MQPEGITMKNVVLPIAALTAMLFMSASTTKAASTDQATLQKEAKISMEKAKEIALKHVKKGSRIASSELEREHGKLIYSFDIREPQRKDVTEVNVNAIDGKIVAIGHENASTEAAEKKQEAKEKH
jgi:uncharacterized membrane protein YkoI